MSYEPLRAPRYEDVIVRGLRHRVTWWGERTASPIVLLHGFQDCGSTWQFLAGVELLFDPRHRHVNPVLYRREEAEACWARVRAPVLLVSGDAHDGRGDSRRAAAEQMRRHVPGLETATVPGAGHMVHHEDPEALARHVVEFELACCSPRAPHVDGIGDAVP